MSRFILSLLVGSNILQIVILSWIAEKRFLGETSSTVLIWQTINTVLCLYFSFRILRLYRD